MEKIEETDEEKTLILVFKRKGGGGQCHSTNTGLGVLTSNSRLWF